MDGIKKARIACCHRCKHRIQKHADHGGPHGYSIFCAAVTGSWIELHDAYMEGPEGNCPAGKWAGLDPVGPTDPEEWAEWNRKRQHKARIDSQGRGVQPVLEAALRGLPIEDVETRLEVPVRAGILEPEVAAEIADKLEAEADAEGG